ncbi:MAG: hypothetical protein KAU90_12150 [Sulfurovaceae bacterium]|nr:hypothetical protein [Sulfurovaceae bacterium]
MKKVLLFTATLIFIGGCGSTNKKKDSINMVDYIPSLNTKNINKKFLIIKDNGVRDVYDESITVNNNTISVKKDDLLTRIVTINDTSIVEDDIDNNLTKILKKSISVGDILYTLPKSIKIEDIKIEDTILGTKKIESTKTCKLENKLTKLEDHDMIYNYDILKFKCIEEKKIVTDVKDDLPEYITLTNGEEKSDYDISYFYMAKNIGLIVKINDDCLVKNNDGVLRINDSFKKCDEKHYSHTFFLE